MSASPWARYYTATGDTPRDTLVAAADAFAAPGFAVDLGCGAGRDTLELLRRGWRVLAIDGEAEAVERLLARAAGERLETEVARFEDARWPTAELVNSSFALPFCPPEAFPPLWSRVVASLPPGGRFSGQLFGDRDGWAGEPDMTFHSRAAVEDLFDGFELERFDEVEENGKTALGEAKHWHLFHVISRKR
jgi:tellurite methyltransferase